MAFRDEQSVSTGSSAQRSVRARRPEVDPSVNLALSTGFECLPSLPITSAPFKFVTSLNLTSVGLGLNSVPSNFRWKLVEWKPKLDRSKVKTGIKSAEDFMKIHGEVEIKDDLPKDIGPQIELELGTGSNLVREFGNESLPICEDYPGNSFEKVGEMDWDEGAKHLLSLFP